MTGLDLKNIHLSYGTSLILKGFDVSLARSGLYMLMGRNGSGKSSILKVLAGLVKTSQGAISYGEQSLNDMSVRQRANLISYLPQDRLIAWDLRAIEIVSLGALDLSEEKAFISARDWLNRFGLADRAHWPVSKLSGGQRARVLLARALSNPKPIVLLDEPLAGLDPAWQRRLLDILASEAHSGRIILMSLHELSLAFESNGEIILMDKGRCLAVGQARDCLDAPNLAQAFGVEMDALKSTPVFQALDRIID